MASSPLPTPDVPIAGPDGRVTQVWYDWFLFVSSLNLPAFSKTAPTNGQVPVYDDTTRRYSPGAN